MNHKTFHLSHGLALMVTEEAKLLCFNPNDNDRAAREMWLAHTEERLRENVRLGLITKTKNETRTIFGYPVIDVEFEPGVFPEDIKLGDFSSYMQFELRKKKKD